MVAPGSRLVPGSKKKGGVAPAHTEMTPWHSFQSGMVFSELTSRVVLDNCTQNRDSLHPSVPLPNINFDLQAGHFISLGQRGWSSIRRYLITVGTTAASGL
jgi:hypothetical protein